MKTNGWEIADDGKAIGKDFVFYIYRKDKFNWGDCFITPMKNGKFKVRLDVSFNKKRTSKRNIVDSFEEAKKIRDKYLIQYKPE